MGWIAPTVGPKGDASVTTQRLLERHPFARIASLSRVSYGGRRVRTM
jgi:hypothetical protein